MLRLLILIALTIYTYKATLKAQQNSIPFVSAHYPIPEPADSLPKLELLAISGDSRWVHPTTFTAGDLRYVANDSIIILAGNDYLTAWDSKKGNLLWEHRFGHKRGYSNMTRSLSVSKEKHWVAAANDGNGLFVFNYYTGKIEKELKFNDAFVFGSISPNGKWGAVYGLSKGWMIWNISKDELYHADEEKITAVAFSPNSEYCAVSRPTDNGIYKVQLINLADKTKKAIDVSIEVNNNCQTLHFSPDGKLLALGFWGGDFAVYDLKSDKLITRQNIDRSWVDGLAFSPDGKKLLVLGAVTIKIWNKDDNYISDWGPANVIYPNNCLEDGVWSKDGKHIMLAAREWQRPRRFRFDASAEEMYKSEGFVFSQVELAFTKKENNISVKTPDGKTVFVDFSTDNGSKKWKAEFNTEKAPLLGKWQSMSVNIQSIDNISLEHTLPAPVEKWHNGPSSLLCEHYFGGFTKDRSLYAGVGNDRIIYVYDGKTGNPLAGVSTKGTYIQAVAISPDGNFLVAIGWDSLLRLYKVPPLK
jgi:WD40 repeat protein